MIAGSAPRSETCFNHQGHNELTWLIFTNEFHNLKTVIPTADLNFKTTPPLVILTATEKQDILNIIIYENQRERDNILANVFDQLYEKGLLMQSETALTLLIKKIIYCEYEFEINSKNCSPIEDFEDSSGQYFQAISIYLKAMKAIPIELFELLCQHENIDPAKYVVILQEKNLTENIAVFKALLFQIQKKHKIGYPENLFLQQLIELLSRPTHSDPSPLKEIIFPEYYYYLNLNIYRQCKKMRTAFAMGFHSRLASESPVLTVFGRSTLFDPKLKNLIFDLVKSSDNHFDCFAALDEEAQDIMITEYRTKIKEFNSYTALESARRVLCGFGIRPDELHSIKVGPLKVGASWDLADQLKTTLQPKHRFNLFIIPTVLLAEASFLHGVGGIIDTKENRIYIFDPQNNRQGAQTDACCRMEEAIKQSGKKPDSAEKKEAKTEEKDDEPEKEFHLGNCEIITPSPACVAPQSEENDMDCGIFCAWFMIGRVLSLKKIKGAEFLYVNPETGEGLRASRDDDWVKKIVGPLLCALQEPARELKESKAPEVSAGLRPGF